MVPSWVFVPSFPSFRGEHRDVTLDLDIESLLGTRFALIAGIWQYVTEARVEFFSEVFLDDFIDCVTAECIYLVQVMDVLWRTLLLPFVVLGILEVAKNLVELSPN